MSLYRTVLDICVAVLSVFVEEPKVSVADLWVKVGGGGRAFSIP